jgi:hypothetical protein
MTNTSVNLSLGTIKNQPDNINLLSPLGFKFFLARSPTVNFFTQKCNIPAISAYDVAVETPFTRLPIGGGKIQFNPFIITFKVDELLINYLEIFNWMLQEGHPDNYSEATTLYNNPLLGIISTITSGSRGPSDGFLIITNSAMAPTYQIHYKQMFPIGLSDVQFDSTVPNEVKYVTCTATFTYQDFSIEPIL